MGRRALPFALVVLATALATWPAIQGRFVYDDQYYVIDNEAVAGDASPWTMPLGHPGQALWRPLTVLSWRSQWTEGGSATRFRVLNVLLHLAVSVGVLLLARALGAGPMGSLLGALLFAVHPVHAEAVGWVTGRAELLATLFVLAAWLAWLRDGRAAGVACVLLFALAALAKENAFVAPLLFLAGDRLLGRRRRIAGRLLGAVAVIGLLLGCRALVLGQWLPSGAPFAPEDLPTRLAVARNITGRAFRLLIWPEPLTIRYHRSEFLTTHVADVLALLAAVAAVVVAWRRQRLAAAAWILVPISMATVLNVVPIGTTFAERFLYLPSVPFCIAAGTLLAALGRRERISGQGLGPSVAVAAVVFGLALPACRAAFRVMNDDLSIWANAAAVAPDDAAARYNHGYFLDQAGRFAAEDLDRPGAAGELLASLRLEPEHPEAAFAHHILGTYALGVRGRSLPELPLAARHLREAIRLQPSLVLPRINLASIALHDPRIVGVQEARAQLRHVLASPSLKPDTRSDGEKMLDQLDALSSPSSGTGTPSSPDGS